MSRDKIDAAGVKIMLEAVILAGVSYVILLGLYQIWISMVIRSTSRVMVWGVFLLLPSSNIIINIIIYLLHKQINYLSPFHRKIMLLTADLLYALSTLVIGYLLSVSMGFEKGLMFQLTMILVLLITGVLVFVLMVLIVCERTYKGNAEKG